MTKSKTKTTSASYPGTPEEERREMEALWAELIDRPYEEEMARQAAERKQAKRKEK